MPYFVPPMPKAGDLRQSIDIQDATQATDEYGEPQQSWTTLSTTSAKVEYTIGKQQFAPEGFNSQVSHTVTIRYNPALTVRPGMRVVNKGHTYTVQYMDDVQNLGIWLRLFVLELAPTS